MISFLWDLVSFVVALAILIAVHEWGHFWVARRCGVKVLRFSLGFGKVLWSKKGKDDTEFSLSLIPLGGYVKMLDERVEPVPEHLLSRSFNRQHLLKRAAIVAAGPFANFVFAIFAFWVMFMVGIPGVKPIIGDVKTDSVAYQAGLRSGMQIIQVNHQPVQTWEDISYGFVNAIGQQDIGLQVQQEQNPLQSLQLSIGDWKLSPDDPLPFRQLGFAPLSPTIEMTLAQVNPGSPAQTAGLQAGDEILAVDDENISDWTAFSKKIQLSPDIPLQIKILRENHTRTVSLTPARKETKERVFGFAGIMPVVKPLPAKYLTEQRYDPWDAAVHAVNKTQSLVELTVRVVGKLFTGAISVDNLSGPVSIAKGAGDSAGFGFVYFLGFLGLISVNLGIMNLLPLPVLDGGHLLFFCVEAVLRRPVSEKVQEIAYRIGAAALISLMAIALFNDFTRF